jgi:hypothetical protein
MTTAGRIDRDRVPTRYVEDVHPDRRSHLLARWFEDHSDTGNLGCVGLLDTGDLRPRILDKDRRVEFQRIGFRGELR